MQEAFLEFLFHTFFGEIVYNVLKKFINAYKGIKLYGKVKFVTSFPDIKIKYVDSFPDIKVKFVSSFPELTNLLAGVLLPLIHAVIVL